MVEMKKGFSIQGKFVTGANVTNSGTLKLRNSALTLFPRSGSVIIRKKIAISELESITILEWKGSEISPGVWIFTPYKFRIDPRKNPSFVSSGRINELESFSCSSGTRDFTVFSCFYDRRHKGTWALTGKKDIKWPEAHPPQECVKSIIFN
jgi:hypothetical protein